MGESLHGQTDGFQKGPILEESGSFDRIFAQRAGPEFDPVVSQPTESESEQDFEWLNQVRVGYDGGIVIASRRELDFDTSGFPYRLKINGWGQLRHTMAQRDAPETDLNQFQLKRGRIIFSGSALSPNFNYYVQLDGRSTSGDDVRLLDYYLNYDLGTDQFGWKSDRLILRAENTRFHLRLPDGCPVGSLSSPIEAWRVFFST